LVLKELDFENRWVKFSNIIPWNELSGFYLKRASNDGSRIKAAGIVLGALIIKHHEEFKGTINIDATIVEQDI
jgi:hypothetical protein